MSADTWKKENIKIDIVFDTLLKLYSRIKKSYVSNKKIEIRINVPLSLRLIIESPHRVQDLKSIHFSCCLCVTFNISSIGSIETEINTFRYRWKATWCSYMLL